jgi:dTDP-glucose 4,6-dehydratase
MIDLTGRRVLVTGADGFIGSHLTEALVREGARVRALVQYNSFGHWGWLETVPAATRDALEVVAGDVRDRHCMAEAVAGCSVVFHLAALIAIPYSYRAPESYLDTNIRGTLALLEAARAAGVEKFVQTSTSEVYGTARTVPIDEEHPLQAQSPYAATKVAADQLALSFQRSFGLPVTVIRPFNTYGPRQSTRAVIPTIITQLAAGAGRLSLGALTPTRDFSYVANTVSGFLAVARHPAAVGEVINIGSGFEISVGATARLIADLMGREVEIVCEAERLRPPGSEVERLFAGIAKAERLLGWRPPEPGPEGFRRGLQRTIEWFGEPANLTRYRGGYQL